MREKKRESVRLGRDYGRLWSATIVSNVGDGISMVAYPWLASAVTRSPLLIALAGMIGRLPWLIFTLPAGVITDRFSRKRIIVAMDLFRGALTFIIATIVLFGADTLPDLDQLTSITNLETNWGLYWVVIISAFLFGCAEVLRDNSAQTFMPAIVEKEKLEVANGRMWSAEFVANSFLGPALGSFLIGVSVALPFFADGATFIIAAVVIAMIGVKEVQKSNVIKVESDRPTSGPFANFKAEVSEGVRWLWNHKLLRSMAIILGLLNLIGALEGALFILFAQEILKTSVFEFAALGTAGAIGGILGGTLGPRISKKFGRARSLALVLIASPVASFATAIANHWLQVWVFIFMGALLGVLWNIITVSLRQSIIPEELLGRVNSVYRLFAWGSLPIGMAIAGGLVQALSAVVSREMALRAPYLLAGFAGLLLFFYSRGRLTDELIQSAQKEAEG